MHIPPVSLVFYFQSQIPRLNHDVLLDLSHLNKTKSIIIFWSKLRAPHNFLVSTKDKASDPTTITSQGTKISRHLKAKFYDVYPRVRYKFYQGRNFWEEVNYPP